MNRLTMLYRMANDAHHSSIDAHGEPVAVELAWEFITQSDETYDAWVGKPMPRQFATQYAAWGRDWNRAQALAAATEFAADPRRQYREA